MFELTFPGTSPSVPSAERNHPGLRVQAGGQRVLVDCGEGTQRQLLRSGAGFQRLDWILLTHAHLDFDRIAIQPAQESVPMARKLKTYQTSLGFYDLAIAAASMKEALEAWGAGSNLFHQGVAKETHDPAVIAATMSKPGVVLRRPAGSSRRFAEHAALPAELGGKSAEKAHGTNPIRPTKRAPRKLGEAAARKAAPNFEKEQKRREAERLREEAAQAKERERRDKAIARAQSALDKARDDHEAEASAIESERAAVERRAHREQTRWEKQEQQLKAALRRAHEE